MNYDRMSNREYSEFTRDLFAKFNAGEMTAEEVCAELDKVDRVWFEDPVNRMMYQMIIYHLVVIVNMMTVETLIIKLGVNPKEISKAELILLTSLVERYNHGYMRRSIYTLAMKRYS